MSKTLLCTAALVASSSLCQAQDQTAALQALMTRAHVPGLSLAYVKNGKVAQTYYLGTRSNDTGGKVDTQTVFQAASLTKVAFAYGVMHLVEQGKLDLDKPLSSYYSYPDLQYDARAAKVTAREVLSHTSGLPNWRNGDTLKFKYNPGERWNYSGEGFVWLGKVVEHITGKELEPWLEETVLQPLGMERSGFIWKNEFDQNYAWPHTETGTTSGRWTPDKVNTAASLHTTADSYAKLLCALLDKKGLKPATFKTMLQPQAHSQVEQGKTTLSWSLGVGRQETAAGPAFWQWGDNGTFKAFLIGYPEKKEGLVYFANSAAGLTIAGDILQLFFGGAQPAIAWVTNEDPDIRHIALLNDLLHEPFTTAMAPFMKGSIQDTAALPESKMNWVAYRLLENRRPELAEQLFRLNTQTYPDSVDAYAGLAEAALRSGRPKEAEQWYTKAATLKPAKTNYKQMALKLDSTFVEPPVAADSSLTFFRLGDFPGAKLVSLAGTFNGWNDLEVPMRWKNGAWEAALRLAPGTYQYKFVIDGVWLSDPRNPKTHEGDMNSILVVTAK
ncbi:serine hydrolase [Chitinophaga pinensis]|uniref:Beta-lactamase n=1 Tax=Chitinophaga pinensis (strain ATCC 43595 / DSM 2588 / LMG 13176 / NBRC 15968 / NCIMB 11800 / UQM 2034) TaxID=485918 RepID=A0A979GTB0_CHIPD|nr:serine hydrolase [Chitinophaga pinensis]ACU61953.1 beta-lactamase [Chitinophaga pinensis DSM 2588]